MLLLDEPLSALDIEHRLRIQDEIVAIYQKTKITTILVSHDVAEVFKLSGKIFVLQDGKVVKSGEPQEIFVDGNSQGSYQCNIQSYSVPDSPLWIGAQYPNQWDLARWFKGRLDDFMLFEQALLPDEVKAIYELQRTHFAR